ncbi:hypothetical protein Dimus_004064 [Dionaea muscipula]
MESLGEAGNVGAAGVFVTDLGEATSHQEESSHSGSSLADAADAEEDDDTFIQHNFQLPPPHFSIVNPSGAYLENHQELQNPSMAPRADDDLGYEKHEYRAADASFQLETDDPCRIVQSDSPRVSPSPDIGNAPIADAPPVSRTPNPGVST